MGHGAEAVPPVNGGARAHSLHTGASGRASECRHGTDLRGLLADYRPEAACQAGREVRCKKWASMTHGSQATSHAIVGARWGKDVKRRRELMQMHRSTVCMWGRPARSSERMI
jgi:hypothetical protein